MYTLEGDAENLLQEWNGAPAPASVFVGLCDQEITKSTALSDITTEPSSAGGYARIELPISQQGFPALELVNGLYRIVSIPLLFQPVGAPYSSPVNYVFLCSVASGYQGALKLGTAPLFANGPQVITEAAPLQVAVPIYRR